jgi:uncharacterized surface protein with fasciclin (FAS1) repeats
MKFKNQILYFVTILSVALMTFSCSNDDNREVTKLPSIVEIAKADANFSIFADALKKTGLDVALGNPGSFTVFAPTNTAFTTAGYSSAVINALNPLVAIDAQAIADLKLRLQNHVLNLGTRSSDLLATTYFKTFASTKTTGTPLFTLIATKSTNDVLLNGGATNGGATITTADVEASNGIMHTVDAVLGLPTIVQLAIANPTSSAFADQVRKSTQTSVLATLNAATSALPLTVYAPTNEVFTEALATSGYLAGKADADITKILNYHIEKGNRIAFSPAADVVVSTLFTPYTFILTKGTVKIVDKSTPAVNANIKVVNIQGSNGVIQITDKVLRSL